MNIGIDISAAVYGTGVGDYTSNLVEQLSKLPNLNLKLFGGSLRRRGELVTKFPQARVWPIPPSLLDLIWNRWHILPVEQLVGKIDVFHSSDWTQPPSKAKKITTVHDLSPFLYPQETDPQIVAVHTRRMQWVARECDHIICVSQNTASDLQRLFQVPAQKITVVYEAMPTKYLLKPQITKHTNYLIAIGAKQPRKNIQRLISAFSTYKDQLSLPPKLIIVGENSFTVNNSDISFTDYISDQQLVDLLAGARALVYPSLYEGFGLPILGAFYHHVPVAASNTSSIPEVTGDAAVLFNPLDEEAIARGIKTAIDTKADLIKKGDLQLQKFSWEKAAQDTLAVYES